jgi:hypothetical protein
MRVAAARSGTTHLRSVLAGRAAVVVADDAMAVQWRTQVLDGWCRRPGRGGAGRRPLSFTLRVLFRRGNDYEITLLLCILKLFSAVRFIAVATS